MLLLSARQGLSRLKRSSSGTDSYTSRDASIGGTPPGPSRLSSAAGKPLARMSSSSSPCAAPEPKAQAPGPYAGLPTSQLMYMEMHDVDCSSYCLGGNLEPHKMWFGVGVHR